MGVIYLLESLSSDPSTYISRTGHSKRKIKRQSLVISHVEGDKLFSSDVYIFVGHHEDVPKNGLVLDYMSILPLPLLFVLEPIYPYNKLTTVSRRKAFIVLLYRMTRLIYSNSIFSTFLFNMSHAFVKRKTLYNEKQNYAVSNGATYNLNIFEYILFHTVMYITGRNYDVSLPFCRDLTYYNYLPRVRRCEIVYGLITQFSFSGFIYGNLILKEGPVSVRDIEQFFMSKKMPKKFSVLYSNLIILLYSQCVRYPTFVRIFIWMVYSSSSFINPAFPGYKDRYISRDELLVRCASAKSPKDCIEKVLKFSDILWLYGINPVKIHRKEYMANILLVSEGLKRGLMINMVFDKNSDPLLRHKC